jgi:uridine kinase
VPRGNARFGDDHDPDPEAESNRRYVGGQRLYLAECDPRTHATWVVANTDLERPSLSGASVEGVPGVHLGSLRS